MLKKQSGLIPRILSFIHWFKQCYCYIFLKPRVYRTRKNTGVAFVDSVECLHLSEQHSVYIKHKPEWVTHEVLRLKALMGKAGCRSVAMTFNRLHGHRVRHASVGTGMSSLASSSPT